MTINEYKSKSGLTNSQLAELLDVSESSIEKYLMGDTASAAVAKRMANIGIEHPYRRARVNSGDGVPTEKCKCKKAKREFDSKILKEYQVVIIREFARFGLKVQLRDFENKNYEGWNTHYVAELVGGLS